MKSHKKEIVPIILVSTLEKQQQIPHCSTAASLKFCLELYGKQLEVNCNILQIYFTCNTARHKKFLIINNAPLLHRQFTKTSGLF